MGNNVSKILDAVLSRTAFNLTKGNIKFSYKDHIALELLQEENSMAYRLLSTKLKEWELLQISPRIERLLRTQPQAEEMSAAEFLYQYRNHILQENTSSRNISTTHAIYDIVADTTTATSQVMAQFGINAHTIASIIREIGDRAEGMFSPVAYHITQANSDQQENISHDALLLSKFGVNLTRHAREGKIDPVIGRNKEIDRVIQILMRRKKNNPVLIGEAGVGKSAIVEGLALRIATGTAPHALSNKEIYSIDMAALVAGTKFRGEFEERMQQLLDELRNAHDVIIFIDEIHTIVGAGASQGSLDTANILKPSLARGEIRLIGATTHDEYRENIEYDSALERRFQRVIVEPTTTAQTLKIVQNIAPYYEQYHNVKYTEDALRACVTLTERYITDRHFPDKAIDLMDEAGARSRIRTAQKSEPMHNTEIMLNDASQKRYEAITALTYEKVATAHIKEIALKSRLIEQHKEWHRSMQENPIIISKKDIEEVITAMTGIPAERISHNEAEQLRSLATHLRHRVIGQGHATDRIAKSLLRARSGLKDRTRPIGVFLLIGPTGVGKTLLAKELSQHLFDQRRGLIRLDMSEYSERHNVARLIGSPPGYVGHGEGGQLTEAVRRQPYAVILFDEIDKAHPDIFNTMLQIFDEGHLSDGSGRKVDFRNTIIIMTSNAGARGAQGKRRRVGYSTLSKENNQDNQSDDEYQRALESTFSPEFLNRIDETVLFRPLTIDDIEQIINLELDSILKRTREQGYSVEITADAKRHLAAIGYDSQYGARALRRTLRTNIEEPLSSFIIEGRLRTGGSVAIWHDENEGLLLQVA